MNRTSLITTATILRGYTTLPGRFALTQAQNLQQAAVPLHKQHVPPVIFINNKYIHVQCRHIIAILFILMNLQFYLQTQLINLNLPLDSVPSHDGLCHRPHQGYVETAIDFRQHFGFGDGLADGKQRSDPEKNTLSLLPPIAIGFHS